jgi:hypothetical protein
MIVLNVNPSGSVDGGKLYVIGEPIETASDYGRDEVNTGG